MCRYGLPTVACLAVVLTAGCKPQDDSPAKAPRPVSVFILQESNPGRRHDVAGTVTSWKTEQVGFEVSGRVEFVVEPDTDVDVAHFAAEAKSPDESPDGEAAPAQATELARLDDTRYQLQVQSILAQIRSAEQMKQATVLEAEQVIPAQEEVANAELRVSSIEANRRQVLVQQRTIPQEEFDRAVADYEKARGRVRQLAAQKEAKRAEVASLDAQIQQLNESLAEAKRDVEDCMLLAPYRGQIAQVHVIPGAFVERGDPAVTIQMMDPIAIEFEVSAATARRLNYRDMVPIYIAQPDDTWQQDLASVYMTDPVADPQTRTFTATLLVGNQKVRSPIPEEMQGKPIIRTDDLWKLLSPDFTQRQAEAEFVEEHAIHDDGQGAFLWKVTNRRINTLASEAEAKLNVVKVRVTRGKRRIPFMGGVWTFQEVALREGEKFDAATDVVTGRLTFPPQIDPATFEGGEILFGRERWMLRPGDLVRVDLRGGAAQPGFYLPVDAILEKSGQSYVFAVESSAGRDRVRQIEVQVFEAIDTLRRVEALGDQPLTAGMRIVAGGALFLADQEVVNVAEEVQLRR